MEFLTKEDVNGMSLEGLIAYRSIFEHLKSLTDFIPNDVNAKLGEVKTRIEEIVVGNIQGYEGISTKEMTKALAIREDRKFMDGLLDKLREAKEALDEEAKKNGEKDQKQELIKVLTTTYGDMIYPMAQVVAILGKQKVISILGKEISAKLVDRTDKNADKKSQNRETIEIEH